MSIEQKINYQLNKYPAVKKVIKRAYQTGMYAISKKIKSEGDITRISPDDKEHEYFFGYYDKSPWDISDRYMLCVKANDTWSDVSPREKADILLIDTQKSESDSSRVKKIAETRAWNVQQSCMLQWLGPDFSSRVLYNDYRDGKYVSVILTLATMEEKVIPAAVYSVSNDGKFALTLDFSRLYELRPGYGYYNVPEKTKGVALPDTTAIWKVDLETGEVIDLLKYTDFANFQPRPEMKEKGAVHKVNHIMISPNGKRFMVLYRWFCGQRKYTRLVTCNVDGTDMYVLSDDDMVSHCFWKNNSAILAFENKKKTGPGYYLMKDKTDKYIHCWPQFSNDGHPSYSPDGKLIVTDSYPDRTRIASINLMDGDERKKKNTTIARVFAPFKYDNDTRCDLHPRWNHAGDKICFDSVFEGHRGVYVVNVPSEYILKRNLDKENSEINKLVSVVIPTHNRADLLPRAIESVLNQTYSNFEIIVVSDGSTDNTEEVVKKYLGKDTRIKFISYSPARGGNVARNTGIDASEGEYVAFLDDDDEWLPQKLEKQVALLDYDEKIGLVYTGVHIIYVNENVEYNSMSKEHGDLRKRILIDNCVGTTSTVILRKSILQESGMFDVELKALQDFDLWIRVAQNSKVEVIPEPMINYYNYLGKKQVSAVTQKYVDAFGYINKKYEKEMNELSIDEMHQKQIEENFLLANKAMRNGEAKLARIYLKRILKNSFSKKAFAYYFLSFASYKMVLKVRSFIG